MQSKDKVAANPFYRIPILVGVVLWAGLAGLFFLERTRARTDAELELIHTAVTIQSVLEGSIRSEMQRGRIRRGRLQSILENVASSSSLKTIELIVDGNAILQAGDASPLPSSILHADSGNLLTESQYFFWKNIRLLECPLNRVLPDECPPEEGTGENGGGRGKGQGGHGRGMGSGAGNAALSGPDGLDFGEGSQKLILGLSLTDFRQHVRSAETRAFITLAVGCMAVTTLVIAWIANLKRQVVMRTLDRIKLRSEQLEEMGLAAVGLAHEIKNPLSIIRGIAQSVLHDPDLRLCHNNAGKILDQADLATERLGVFMNYARLRKPEPTSILLGPWLEKLVSVLQPEFQEAGVELTVQEPSLTVLADDEMLTQVIINLTLNSLKASIRGGCVRIEAESRGKYAEIRVRDNGCGIPLEKQEEIFKPYVTLFPDGHGIGLAVVKRITEESDWTLGVESAPGQGTCIRLGKIRLAG